MGALQLHESLDPVGSGHDVRAARLHQALNGLALSGIILNDENLTPAQTIGLIHTIDRPMSNGLPRSRTTRIARV
jgi:hypothetical protein